MATFLVTHFICHRFVTLLSIAPPCAGSSCQFLEHSTALAHPSRQSPVPTDSERPLNSTLKIHSRGRKERHQHHQRHQLQQEQQQLRQQQPPAQPDVARERRVSEHTSKPEPGRDLVSRSPRTTSSAPKQTTPHTYPPSRRNLRTSTSQAGQSRSQFPSSVAAPAVPSSQPLPNNKYPATACKLPPPPPLPLSLPTPSSILLPPPHRQHQHQHRQQQPNPNPKLMGTEHRDQRDGKPGLRTWWQHITTTQKPRPHGSSGNAHAHSALKAQGLAQEYVPPPPGAVFGRPLKESLRYASVQISTADASGRLYVWGYIPVVVAKCGLFLKENATEIEGTFRVNGSNKRMRDLQAVFETPPRYGKSLDWKKENYTTHDVASVFRRFLTQLTEPVIPYDLYFPFRDAIAKTPYNQDMVITTYKKLIHSMPHANQYLLLYVLDLLSVFARKAEKNLMTAQNLAVIFRPGLMSHETHELSPSEHRLSQEVLEFLIAHQDWFMLDTPPPPAPPPTPSRSLTPPLSPGASVSVSDGEGPEGWRIIDRHPRISGDPGRYGGAAGKAPRVTRSRTLPSSRNGRASTMDAGTGQRGAGPSGSTPGPALLRKGRRVSAQPA